MYSAAGDVGVTASAGHNSTAAVRAHDKTAFHTIYPQYLDATLLPREGRRLTRTQAVDNPSIEEMVTVLAELGYTRVVVDRSKSLPCSQSSSKFALVPRGCIRVAIKTATDEHYIRKSDFDVQRRGAVVDGIGSKQALLRRMAAAIKARGVPRPERATVATVLASLSQPATKTRK